MVVRPELPRSRDGYGIGRDGLSALDIVKAARNYGMRVRAISVRGQIDEFRFVSLPAIVHWEFNHFMVVERWSANHVDVVDPAVGRKRLSREEFRIGFHWRRHYDGARRAI